MVINYGSDMKIGRQLSGSGSSRGWAHIGVIKALAEQGIVPDIICGTSIGALVGAAHVAGNLEKLESWICSLSRFETASFFELNTSFSGFVNTSRLHSFLNEYVADERALIEDFPASIGIPWPRTWSRAARSGSPGAPCLRPCGRRSPCPDFFPPSGTQTAGSWTEGWSTPCLSPSAGRLGRRGHRRELEWRHRGQAFREGPKEKRKNGMAEAFTNLVKEYAGPLFSFSGEEDEPPGLFDAIAGSVNIAQERITRSRLAGDPPDILLSPKLSHIGLLEFFRAGEAIAEGKKCVQRMLPEIEHVLGAR